MTLQSGDRGPVDIDSVFAYLIIATEVSKTHRIELICIFHSTDKLSIEKRISMTSKCIYFLPHHLFS